MLTVHRARRTAPLAAALAQLLAAPPADPFAAEVVAVPAKGVERWLTQCLSTTLGATAGDGVAACIDFPSPARLVEQAIAAAGGMVADDDPWSPGRVLWRLLDVMDDCVDEPWCDVLATHLGGDAADGPDGTDGLRGQHRTGRRYAAAEHLRDLFRSYAAHRPQMLVDWARGDDTDGAGEPLDPDQRWQAELWRRLRTALAAPSPAERLAATCLRLRDEPTVSDLPERLSIFGATRLTTEQRAVVSALAAHRDVHVFLPHASPAMWAALAATTPATRRRDDASALAVRHPLLASLARDTRELQQLLGPDVASVHHDAEPPPPTLLGAVQRAIAEDSPPVPSAEPDGTVQVHACHGAPRQVEVLREALLHLFEADPSLEPRDVLVMCPDVESYAPLVRAAFGRPEAHHPGHRLRVRLADRSLRRTNPLLDTVSGLLDLADGRVTAADVLDLAASGPVRRAFGFTDDELDRLRDWADRAGIRWGLGARQRAAYGLARVEQGTWATGLDRILLGVAADETDLAWLDRALPLDDVDSTDAHLAGRLAELVDRLDHVLGRLHGAQPVSAWVDALGEALDLLTDVPEADVWQAAQARRSLAEAAEHGGETVLRLPDVRAMLRSRLAGRPTRANFRTGELTVATLVPMRSVPHRVVALLGVDDGAFPRGGDVDGDDVLQRDPCLGERDVRSEDRQLLLDAVMAAGDHLLLLYTGADPVTGATRPPAVPLGELLDVVRDTVGPDAMDRVVTRHPLQPFDARNFAAEQPFSHDTDALAGARAAAGQRAPEPRLVGAPLPVRRGEVALADLVAFVTHPTRAFLTQRLGVRVPDEEDEVRAALPVALDPLQTWGVGDRMLSALLAGTAAGAVAQAEWRRGTLPPGPIGRRVLDEVAEAVGPLAEAARPYRTADPTAVDVRLDLGDGRLLVGTVPDVHDGVVTAASYSRLAPKHRLTAWVRLLAAAGLDPPGATSAVTVGRGRRGPVQRSTLLPPTDPVAVLRDVVDLRDEGLRSPLPLVTGASHEYADRRRSGSDPAEAVAAARRAWDPPYGDSTDRAVRYVHGEPPDLDRLLAAPGSREPTRFGDLARRLWEPLLAAETLDAS